MEGYSSIVYKDKKIFYIDYSNFGKDKAKALQLVNTVSVEWAKEPPASIIALVNVSQMHFDIEVATAFKNSTVITAPHEKKIAIVGIKGLLKVAYNFVSGLQNSTSRELFETELEAKEWLVTD